jgi:hypothetical protein
MYLLFLKNWREQSWLRLILAAPLVKRLFVSDNPAGFVGFQQEIRIILRKMIPNILCLPRLKNMLEWRPDKNTERPLGAPPTINKTIN